MTSAQLIVLALLVAAFVSGWVARGAGGPSEEAPGPDAARLLDEAAADLEAVIDAWLDGEDPSSPADRFEATRSRVRQAASGHPADALDDAADALDEAAAVFADARAGTTMSAGASRRLSAVEEALSRAAALLVRA